jgi:hypothetical protein
MAYVYLSIHYYVYPGFFAVPIATEKNYGMGSESSHFHNKTQHFEPLASVTL